ncbi:hypothetical protein PM082_007883 [Marasmius tenuissimus]|nr:hypothetical protein PM082_007883 [Marasmius tenuissimus]
MRINKEKPQNLLMPGLGRVNQSKRFNLVVEHIQESHCSPPPRINPKSKDLSMKLAVFDTKHLLDSTLKPVFVDRHRKISTVGYFLETQTSGSP